MMVFFSSVGGAFFFGLSFTITAFLFLRSVTLIRFAHSSGCLSRRSRLRFCLYLCKEK